MRIAAISDIHGDLRSLQVVWSDIELRGLADGRLVLNAGDTVAYGADTMACIDFVRDSRRNIVNVGGNYDANSSRFPMKENSYRQKWGRLRPDKLAALKRASDDLTDDARTWLATLPQRREFEIEGKRLSVSHYAPTVDKEGLFDTTPQSRLLQIAQELDGAVDIVIVGHTHSPFVRREGGILFVNPGAVGRSYGRPTYAEIAVEANEAADARIIQCHVSQP